MCGRIAHEWPAYTPSQVAKLPFSHYRALRALLLRAHYVPSKDEMTEKGLKSVDMDEFLGIGDQDDAS
jgi:hypothetical protein